MPTASGNLSSLRNAISGVLLLLVAVIGLVGLRLYRRFDVTYQGRIPLWRS